MEINKLILAFVTLILGLVFITQIATSGQAITQPTYTTDTATRVYMQAAGAGVNETRVYTVTNYPTSWKTEDCPISSFVLANDTGTAITNAVDYTLTASAGTFVMINTTASNQAFKGTNLTTVSYRYCGDDYLNVGWGRSVINITMGFFALALLFVSVSLFYSIAKEQGIIGK